MLGDISVADNIYIVCGTTDMRKSIDGLCSIVRDKLSMDPDQSSLFLFCGKRCDRIKVLLREPDGYVAPLQETECCTGTLSLATEAFRSSGNYLAAAGLAAQRTGH